MEYSAWSMELDVWCMVLWCMMYGVCDYSYVRVVETSYLDVFCILFSPQYSGFLPDVFSKFFAFFGLASVLNPLLILLVDLCYHHYNCPSVSSACDLDYTSSDCECFNGDFVKLWYRMERIEGSGLTGLVITSMLYLGCGVLGKYYQ
ncbi:hypothetical protein EON63_13475 [archaeon]|nr:MAG: hypothetical protein EON63_13475 [archaeon]